jgi:LuxR family maltose regulon positive regulatory protein
VRDKNGYKKISNGKVMPALAKLSIPLVSKGYRRAALQELFDRRRGTEGLWIAGLPGSGKTTALVAYLNEQSAATLWYRCDEGDREPAALFHYLAQFLKAGSGPAIPVLTPELAANLKMFSRQFFRHVFSLMDAPFSLVFDDFQEASNTGIDQILLVAMDELPTDCSIYFVSRIQPSPDFAKKRANGNLGMITATDMRLSFEDAREIARKQWRAELSELRVRRIFDATDGWAAGIALLGALDQDLLEDIGPATIEPTVIFDYFAAEIVRKIGPAKLRVLFHAALVPSVSAALAAVLANDPEAGNVLREFFDRGWFITATSAVPPVYQFHPLFRTFLIEEGRTACEPDVLSAARQRAARYLAEGDQWELGLELASASTDLSLFRQLLNRHGATLVKQGRYKTLQTWTARLGEDDFRREPWLAYWHASAQIPYNLNASQDGFKDAFYRFKLVNDIQGLAASWAAIVNALCIDAEGDFSRLDCWLAEFDALQLADLDPADIHTAFDVAYSIYYALYFRAPQDKRASYWRKRALELAIASGDTSKQANVIQRAVVHDLLVGNHARAGLHMATFRSLEPDTQHSPRIAAAIKFTEVYFLYRVGKFDEALEKMRLGLEVAATSGYTGWTHHLLSHGAAAAISKQDFQLAASLLQQLGDRAKGSRGFGAQYLHVLSAWYALCRDNLAAAREHAEAAVGLCSQTNHILFNGCSALARAIVAFRQNDRALAHTDLSVALDIARTIESEILEHMCCLIQADFAFSEERTDDGFAALARALRLGCHQQYNNFIFWMPATMQRLCALALDAGIEKEYVTYLIRSRQLVADARASQTWPWPVRIVTFDHFQVFVDDRPLEFGRKEPKKLMSLLKAIIAFGGGNVQQTLLIDSLWPDQDGDEAQMALDKAVQRLRKLLGEHSLLSKGGRIGLNPDLVWTDARAMTGLASQTAPAPTIEQRRQILLQYQRPFLNDDTDYSWILPKRQQFQDLFSDNVDQVGANLLQKGRFDHALVLFEHALKLDPGAEGWYQRALFCLGKLGRFDDAVGLYEQMHRFFSKRFGKEPSPLSDRLRDVLLAQSASQLQLDLLKNVMPSAHNLS